MIVNEESLGFGLLVGQKKLEMKCYIFQTFSDLIINCLLVTIICRLIDN